MCKKALRKFKEIQIKDGRFYYTPTTIVNQSHRSSETRDKEKMKNVQFSFSTDRKNQAFNLGSKEIVKFSENTSNVIRLLGFNVGTLYRESLKGEDLRNLLIYKRRNCKNNANKTAKSIKPPTVSPAYLAKEEQRAPANNSIVNKITAMTDEQLSTLHAFVDVLSQTKYEYPNECQNLERKLLVIRDTGNYSIPVIERNNGSCLDTSGIVSQQFLREEIQSTPFLQSYLENPCQEQRFDSPNMSSSPNFFHSPNVWNSPDMHTSPDMIPPLIPDHFNVQVPIMHGPPGMFEPHGATSHPYRMHGPCGNAGPYGIPGQSEMPIISGTFAPLRMPGPSRIPIPSRMGPPYGAPRLPLLQQPVRWPHFQQNRNNFTFNSPNYLCGGHTGSRPATANYLCPPHTGSRSATVIRNALTINQGGMSNNIAALPKCINMQGGKTNFSKSTINQSSVTQNSMNRVPVQSQESNADKYSTSKVNEKGIAVAQSKSPFSQKTNVKSDVSSSSASCKGQKVEHDYKTESRELQNNEITKADANENVTAEGNVQIVPGTPSTSKDGEDKPGFNNTPGMEQPRFSSNSSAKSQFVVSHKIVNQDHQTELKFSESSSEETIESGQLIIDESKESDGNCIDTPELLYQSTRNEGQNSNQRIESFETSATQITAKEGIKNDGVVENFSQEFTSFETNVAQSTKRLDIKVGEVLQNPNQKFESFQASATKISEREGIKVDGVQQVFNEEFESFKTSVAQNAGRLDIKVGEALQNDNRKFESFNISATKISERESIKVDEVQEVFNEEFDSLEPSVTQIAEGLVIKVGEALQNPSQKFESFDTSVSKISERESIKVDGVQQVFNEELESFETSVTPISEVIKIGEELQNPSQKFECFNTSATKISERDGIKVDGVQQVVNEEFESFETSVTPISEVIKIGEELQNPSQKFECFNTSATKISERDGIKVDGVQQVVNEEFKSFKTSVAQNAGRLDIKVGEALQNDNRKFESFDISAPKISERESIKVDEVQQVFNEEFDSLEPSVTQIAEGLVIKVGEALQNPSQKFESFDTSVSKISEREGIKVDGVQQVFNEELKSFETSVAQNAGRLDIKVGEALQNANRKFESFDTGAIKISEREGIKVDGVQQVFSEEFESFETSVAQSAGSLDIKVGEALQNSGQKYESFEASATQISEKEGIKVDGLQHDCKKESASFETSVIQTAEREAIKVDAVLHNSNRQEYKRFERNFTQIMSPAVTSLSIKTMVSDDEDIKSVIDLDATEENLEASVSNKNYREESRNISAIDMSPFLKQRSSSVALKCEERSQTSQSDSSVLDLMSSSTSMENILKMLTSPKSSSQNSPIKLSNEPDSVIFIRNDYSSDKANKNDQLYLCTKNEGENMNQVVNKKHEDQSVKENKETEPELNLKSNEEQWNAVEELSDLSRASTPSIIEIFVPETVIDLTQDDDLNQENTKPLTERAKPLANKSPIKQRSKQNVKISQKSSQIKSKPSSAGPSNTSKKNVAPCLLQQNNEKNKKSNAPQRPINTTAPKLKTKNTHKQIFNAARNPTNNLLANRNDVAIPSLFGNEVTIPSLLTNEVTIPPFLTSDGRNRKHNRNVNANKFFGNLEWHLKSRYTYIREKKVPYPRAHFNAFNSTQSQRQIPATQSQNATKKQKPNSTSQKAGSSNSMSNFVQTRNPPKISSPKKELTISIKTEKPHNISVKQNFTSADPRVVIKLANPTIKIEKEEIAINTQDKKPQSKNSTGDKAENPQKVCASQSKLSTAASSSQSNPKANDTKPNKETRPEALSNVVTQTSSKLTSKKKRKRGMKRKPVMTQRSMYTSQLTSIPELLSVQSSLQIAQLSQYVSSWNSRPGHFM